jgi:lysyl endopeptidase
MHGHRNVLSRISFAIIVLTCLTGNAPAQNPGANPMRTGPSAMAPGSAGPAEERPTAQVRQALPLSMIDHFAEPPLDLESIAKEDEGIANEGGPPRYAIPHVVSMTPGSSGTWEQLDDHTMLWRLQISSADAMSINLGFRHYHMPQGGRLMVYSSDYRHVIRPFTYEDNADHNQLWTPPVAGESLVIEVTLPSELVPLLDLELGSINVGYLPFMIPPELVADNGIRSGACNIDVACPQGLPWASQIQSVGVISTGGSTFCTGFMVNNTANDLKPYFMTAHHCTITSGNAASLVVFWNYQNSFCRPPGSPQSGQPGDGSLSTFSTGSTLRADFATSDFTLVELSQQPNPAWNISFAGWSREDIFPPSGACIHHPNTDEKRITFYDVADRPDRPSHGSSWGCSPFPGPGDSTHIRVYWKLEGAVTEPGSSGSPLFDNNKRIIGQLHGGPSACGATGDNLSDCYGRIWRSWTGGGSSASRLSDWLDPGNSGALTTDTLSGGGLNVLPAVGVTHVGIVGGPFSNPSTKYTINNATATSANYTVSLVAGGTAPILINGGTSPISGSVPSGGPSASITVSLDGSANSLPAGIYNTTVRFQDTTHSLTFDRVHRLEVGQTGFNTTPANGLSSGGPNGGPFNATQVYTLTSTQPTAVNIQISANQPWISINGGTIPVNINLNGVGATANVTIGYSAAATSLANGLYNGTVSFTNQSGGTGNTTRPVTLDVGRYSYPSLDTPLPIPDVATVVSTVNVPDTYCIGNVIVDLNLSHTYVGDLVVTLTHLGTSVVLINRPTTSGGGACSSNDYQVTLDDAGAGGPIQTTCGGSTSDPTPTSPPSYTPNSPLSAFNNIAVNGIWTLSVQDAASTDTGTLNSWTLKIAASPNPCPPPPQVVYSYPLDSNPGWTTQGQWQFGHPTGGGSHNFDPGNGYTGVNVYGYNLAGDYPDSLSPTQYLTTTAINCSGLTNVKLQFRRWLGIESSQYDHANIQVSNNGSTWVDVWNHSGASLSENSWSLQSYNLGAVADNQPMVFIRWGIGTTDGSVSYPGWNIDDIEILANIPVQCDLPGDVNDDGKISGLDIGPFARTLLNPGGATNHELCASDVLDDNAVNMGDVNPFVNLLLSQ